MSVLQNSRYDIKHSCVTIKSLVIYFGVHTVVRCLLGV